MQESLSKVTRVDLLERKRIPELIGRVETTIEDELNHLRNELLQKNEFIRRNQSEIQRDLIDVKT